MVAPRWSLIAGLVFTYLATGADVARAQVEYEHMRADGRDIRMTKIADGIYQFMTVRDSYVRQLNSIAVVNDSDVLVFDTNTRPSTARLILAAIRGITDKPVRYVVNSHGHPDHWSGNMVYVDAFPHVDVIATAQMRAIMQRMVGIWVPRFTTELAARREALAAERKSGLRADSSALTPEQLRQDTLDLQDYATFTDESAKLRRVFPTITYTDTMSFFHGGREFRFMSMTGDQEGTTVLWLPRERVLLTGDAISYPMPYVSNKPRAQLASLHALRDLGPAVIVPGHGPAFHDFAFLDLEMALIQSVLDGVAKARAGGARSLEELQKAVTAEEVRERLTHGDSDLESRFRSRVKDLVGFVASDSTG